MGVDIRIVCPCCKHPQYERSLTFNLYSLAMHCGLSAPIYSPYACDIAWAWQLIEPLTKGIAALEALSDAECERFYSPNKEGNRHDLMNESCKLLDAAKKYSTSKVDSR